MTTTTHGNDQLPEMQRPIAVIAGAGGFIGGKLVHAFRSDGYLVRTIGRVGADAVWSDPDSVAALIDGCAVLVNLAGRSVGCRYTDANREEILSSRVNTTRALRDAVSKAARPPAVWLNASTATIYRHATDRPQTEDEGELGSGFSVDVATTWESEFFAGDLPGTRRVALRMAIVLGEGPAKRQLFRAAKLGLGGASYDGWWFTHRRYRGIGPSPTAAASHTITRPRGSQRFSWIHIDDLVGAIRHLRDGNLSGPVNLSAPTASTNAALMRAIRRRVGMPIGLPTFRWMLEIGMMVLRNESELLLKSRWVAPQRLLDDGFEFAYRDLDVALDSLDR